MKLDETHGYKICWFTWENGGSLSNNIRECLDRGLATKLWCDMFPNHELLHLNSSTSDHNPILLSIDEGTTKRQCRKRKRIHFEAMWFKEKECEDIIKKFQEQDEGVDVMSKILSSRIRLQQWHNVEYGALREKIQVLNRELEEVKYILKQCSSRRKNVKIS